MKLLLDVLMQKSESNQIPIWLMRQAGRYLPEYKDLRKKAGSFLNLCYNPSLATEVTLQPINRFDFDAAIIFSDILIVPDILGCDVEFLEGEGPRLDILREVSDVDKLNISDLYSSDKMRRVCEAISLTKSKLGKDKTLIGFAGAPWTVATYMLSEKRQDFNYLRKLTFEKNILLDRLIEILITQTIIYLIAQIESGADVIQIFDSWAGALCEEEYRKYVIEPNKKIVSELKRLYPNVPIICFPKGSGVLYKEFTQYVEPNGLSVDYLLPLEYIQDLQQNVVIQGNLDPMTLLSNKDLIEKKVEKILLSLGHSSRFIFNLGHGIDKETPIENVLFMVEYVKNWKRAA